MLVVLVAPVVLVVVQAPLVVLVVLAVLVELAALVFKVRPKYLPQDGVTGYKAVTVGIIVTELRDAKGVRVNSRSESQHSSISADFARRCVAFRLNVVARA